MYELHEDIRKTAAHNPADVAWAFATAHLYVQIELINTLLAEKAISGDALQRMLDELRSREYAQPPLNQAETLGRRLVPEFVEHIRRSVDWDRDQGRWPDDPLPPAIGSEPK